jgi:hypothetical protein
MAELAVQAQGWRLVFHLLHIDPSAYDLDSTPWEMAYSVLPLFLLPSPTQPIPLELS